MATADDEEPDRRPSVNGTGLQHRFEQSRAGKVTISALLIVIVVVCVISNLPESPIRRSLLPAAKPVAVMTGFDQGWALYAPNPNMRVDTVEVQVKMADGDTKVWTMEPGADGIGWWDRWLTVRIATVLDASVRPQIARWVARKVSEPTNRAVGVSVVLQSEILTAPDEPQRDGARRSTAAKVLYQEKFANPL
jgi:hypothetical protein